MVVVFVVGAGVALTFGQVNFVIGATFFNLVAGPDSFLARLVFGVPLVLGGAVVAAGAVDALSSVGDGVATIPLRLAALCLSLLLTAGWFAALPHHVRLRVGEKMDPARFDTRRYRRSVALVRYGGVLASSFLLVFCPQSSSLISVQMLGPRGRVVSDTDVPTALPGDSAVLEVHAESWRSTAAMRVSGYARGCRAGCVAWRRLGPPALTAVRR